MTMMITEIFSSKLCQLMQTEKVSICKLSINAEVQRKSISLYLQGKCMPRYDSLARIADYFMVSADYLLGKEEDYYASYKTVCAIREIPEHFVKCLEKFMNEYNLSQGELSRRLHMQQATVSKWLHQKAMPEPDAFLALAKLFDCKVDYFFNREQI